MRCREIKKERKIFFLGAWLGAFVGGQHSAEAQALVHSWLEAGKRRWGWIRICA